MKISVLASGSSGNSTFVESKESCVLFDAGISAREIQKRLSKIGKEISDIDAVFITHEHTDHIRGVERLNKSFFIPVYLNRPTYEFSSLTLEKPAFFANNNDIKFSDLTISPFSISHDAADPCGFKIKENGSTLGIMTDFGKSNNEIKDTAKEADALVLETNHDIDMLLNGPYPYPLKQRILGEKGHFSNVDAGLLVKNNASEKLRKVFLAHLSKNNNTEELAYNTFSKLTEDNKRLERIMTKQQETTEIYKI
jgi:phosphoribosyl 1,2-cyclic phosphodiesterase